MTQLDITIKSIQSNRELSCANPEKEEIPVGIIAAGDNEYMRGVMALAMNEGARILIVGDANELFSCGPQPIKLVAQKFEKITTVKNPFEIPNNRKGRRMAKFPKNKRRFFEEVSRKPKLF